MKRHNTQKVGADTELLSGWVLNKTHSRLNKSFVVDSYIDALAHVARIAVYAEIYKHYPVVQIQHDQVSVTIVKKDTSQKISRDDMRLALKIETIFKH
ncbi:MAG TPA: 4a-hydroxytetrahydrobiopterin dehydratase [Candidatus Paceibacterota bacterium]|nr:4a-hydroxytetrahydrobiopterin dehydratase [Candidatus Paceibacterota bacterium]